MFSDCSSFSSTFAYSCFPSTTSSSAASSSTARSATASSSSEVCASGSSSSSGRASGRSGPRSLSGDGKPGGFDKITKSSAAMSMGGGGSAGGGAMFGGCRQPSVNPSVDTSCSRELPSIPSMSSWPSADGGSVSAPSNCPQTSPGGAEPTGAGSGALAGGPKLSSAAVGPGPACRQGLLPGGRPSAARAGSSALAEPLVIESGGAFAGHFRQGASGFRGRAQREPGVDESKTSSSCLSLSSWSSS
mmetsp:Transcript_47088/g.82872  ORF Transcript_47088/g.82872 Transcript_47088/m.82872 type:complete len:246 (-) Transcript_47088:867-1604(-)